REGGHETSLSKFSASGRNRRRAAGRLALRLGADLSDAAGARHRRIHRWQQHRHCCTADRPMAFGTARPTVPYREPPGRQRQYRRYLGSAFWRERREHILKRANYTCEKCGKRPAAEVHHLTYIRIYQELPSDLVALCKPCHNEIHWRQPANDNQI